MLTLGIQGLVEGESGLKQIELSYRQKKFLPMVRELNRKGASRFSGKRRSHFHSRTVPAVLDFGKLW
jgi:hypothetical protein